MWIELHSGTRDHPKIIKLSRDLGIDKAHALGLITSLWLWVLNISPDGDLSSFDEEDLELGANWTGKPGKFVQCALKRRLIDRTESGLAIHDWLDYAQHLKVRERKQRERARKKGSNISSGNSNPSRDVTECHVTSQEIPVTSQSSHVKSRDVTGNRPTDRQTDRQTHTLETLVPSSTRARMREAPQVCVCDFSNPEPDSDRPTLPCPPPEAPVASVDPEVAKADLVARALSATHLAITGHATVISKKNVHLTQLIQWGIEERSYDPVGPIVNAYKAYLNSNGAIKENGYPFAWFAKEPAKYLLASKPDRKAEKSKKAADEYIDKMNISDKYSVQCPTEIKDLIKTLKGVAANGT